MLDMKLTLLCAELPLLLLLVILLAVWVVQLILNRRTKEEAAENQIAADSAVAQQQSYNEQPVFASNPEEESYEQQPEEEQVMQESAFAEEPAEEPEQEEEPEEFVEESAEEPETTEDLSQPEEQTEGGAMYNLTGNSVVFERGDNVRQTWTEKYEALEEEQRKMLDELFAHICGEDGVRRLDLTSNVRVKYKTHELFKADIKRGVPVLNFMLSNTSLMRYVKEMGTKKIKITPVTVKLNDNDDLQLALRTADMALEQAKSEEEFKKERRKEQRREREQAKRGEAN